MILITVTKCFNCPYVLGKNVEQTLNGQFYCDNPKVKKIRPNAIDRNVSYIAAKDAPKWCPYLRVPEMDQDKKKEITETILKQAHETKDEGSYIKGYMDGWKMHTFLNNKDTNDDSFTWYRPRKNE